MLPSNIARKQKITSVPSFFFKGAGVSIIVDSVDVLAELGLFDESIRKGRTNV